ATLRRQSPEVGAVCGNPARTVLCGGRSAMSVPTAIFASPGFGFSFPRIWIFLPKALKILPQTLPSLVFHVKQLPIFVPGQRAGSGTATKGLQSRLVDAKVWGGEGAASGVMRRAQDAKPRYTARRLRWRYWSATTAAMMTPPLM